MENKPKADNADTPPEKVRRISAVKFRRGVLMVLLIVVFLVPAAIALWWSYQHQQAMGQLEDELQLIAGLHAETQALEATLQKGLSDLQNEQVNMVEMLQRQQAAIIELQNKSPLSTAEIEFKWALAEVEYLFQLANQRTSLANDAVGAAKALALADEKLRDVNDYRLQALRELVAEESLALGALTKIDIAGMAAEMQSAINAVDSLRVVRGPKLQSQDPMSNTGADLSERADWQDAVSDIWQQVKSLVVIRQQTDAPKVVLMPEQRYFLYQNLKLKLETSRFALLSGNQSVFDSSLTSAIEWLEWYFTGDSRDALLNSLKSLQAQNIVVDIPDISGSLRWLQGFES